MDILSYLMIPLTVSLIVPMILARIRQKNAELERKIDDKNFIIRNPIWAFWLSAAIAIVFSIITLLANIFNEVKIYENILFISFILLFLIFCLMIIRFRISVDEKTIIIRPFIGKTKKHELVSVSDIKAIKLSNNSTLYRIYIGKKKILSINNSFTGANILIKRINEERFKEDINKQIQNIN